MKEKPILFTREEVAVAEAIKSIGYKKTQHNNHYVMERQFYIEAKAAIAASNSKYIAGLVEALKEIEGIGSAASLIASIALGNLPEELQG